MMDRSSSGSAGGTGASSGAGATGGSAASNRCAGLSGADRDRCMRDAQAGGSTTGR